MIGHAFPHVRVNLITSTWIDVRLSLWPWLVWSSRNCHACLILWDWVVTCIGHLAVTKFSQLFEVTPLIPVVNSYSGHVQFSPDILLPLLSCEAGCSHMNLYQLVYVQIMDHIHFLRGQAITPDTTLTYIYILNKDTRNRKIYAELVNLETFKGHRGGVQKLYIYTVIIQILVYFMHQ